VTKSSTEAELLSLSHATSELLWWKRFFTEIRLKFDKEPAMYCDNRQTLRIIKKEAAKLDTKLRHVDIHQHWLRQEYEEGRIKFDWLPTKDMPADGLTKLLPPYKHEAFVRQLNLQDPPMTTHSEQQVNGSEDTQGGTKDTRVRKPVDPK
jgi:hypothetical protein